MADWKEQVLRTSGVNPLKCMRCGKCSATCPSYDAMEYHPHQFVYMVEKGNIEPLMQSKKCGTSKTGRSSTSGSDSSARTEPSEAGTDSCNAG